MELNDVLKQETKAKIIWYLREGPRTYSEILKHLKERDSGKFNYHLKILISLNLIKKEDEIYSLTKQGLKNALYIDSLQLKEKYPIPIVMVAVMKKNKILLAKRSREPFKDLWGLPGNEILYGETPTEAGIKEIQTELKKNITAPEIYGVYPTIFSENEEPLYHTIIIAVKTKETTFPDSGIASGKICEYKFFKKSELKKLKIIPTNMQPILDAFSSNIKIKNQNL